MDESLQCGGAQSFIWLWKALWCANRGRTLLSGKSYAISNKCLGFLNTRFKPAAEIGDKKEATTLGNGVGLLELQGTSLWSSALGISLFQGMAQIPWWEARRVSVAHSPNSDKCFIFDILGHLLQTSQSTWLLPSGQSAICSICRLGRRAFSPKGNYSDEGKGQATHSGMLTWSGAKRQIACSLHSV